MLGSRSTSIQMGWRYPSVRRGADTSNRRRQMQPAAIKPMIPLAQIEAVDVRVGTIDTCAVTALASAGAVRSAQAPQRVLIGRRD